VKLIFSAKHFFETIENNAPTSKNFQPVISSEFNYLPGEVKNRIDIGNKNVIILTDSEDDQTNLGRIIQRFSQSFSTEIEVIDLNNVDIKGGSLGCIKCGYANNCSYDGKDGYREYFNTKVKAAEVIVIAGTIKDRYLSSR
jgi:hypothetical protein